MAFYPTFFRLWVFTPFPLKFVTDCSVTPAFWWHETNSFLCLTTSALTHDVFQSVSFHPHSHCNLLRIAQRASGMHWRFFCVVFGSGYVSSSSLHARTSSDLTLLSPALHSCTIRIVVLFASLTLWYVNETKSLFFCQIFTRGADGKCTICSNTEGDHYAHPNGNKYCVSICLHLCLNSL